MSIYLNNPWKAVKHVIFKNDADRDEVFEQGYMLAPKLGKEQLEKLQTLFNSTHNLENGDGGMFYSVYSQDLSYRKKIHEEIGQILQPYLEERFKDYKVMINSFVVKLSGPKSEFYLHQDTTGLDEKKYSPLNLWIPLIDVDESNGCLGIIPKSHKWFSPYRSISFPAPFDTIQSTVKQYLSPTKMKAGEVLIFDNRLLHHSYSNESGETRIAVICGLFPKEAKLETCHKPEYTLGGEVERIEQPDDFLLKHPKFLIDCQDRPEMGKSLGFEPDPYEVITKETFELLCESNGVKQRTEYSDDITDCNLIGEPFVVEHPVKASWYEKILALFD